MSSEDMKLFAPLIALLPLILVFIYRRWGHLIGDALTDLASPTLEVEPVSIEVNHLEVPFTVKLKKDAESQYNAEVCSTVPNWTLFAVKNMKIDTALSDILKIDSSDTYFDDVTSVVRNEGATITEYDKPGNHYVGLGSEESCMETGEHRRVYPLLLFVTNYQNTLVTLVHIGDSLIKESYIIAQFHRNQSGAFHRLTALYSSADSVEDECSVCLTNTASCVILPCRHRCACELCMTRLRYCPLCRTAISSYFNTDQNISHQ